MKLIKLIAAGLLAALPLRAADSTKPPPPAKVTKPGKELDLANITLTAEAEKRLGITTAAVERRKVERTRLFGGEIILPARSSGNGSEAAPGQPAVFTIQPSSTPADILRLAQAQVDADGQVEQAKVQVDAARVALARAEQLLRDKAGSVRVVDEAKVQVGLGEATFRTAQARRQLLGPAVMDAANQPTLWARVSVYVGDWSKLNTAASAHIGGLMEGPVVSPIEARPISAPPSANAAASTVDLFYEVTNTNGALRLGQRVGVTLPLRTEQESLVVPWSAILHDVQGGTWLYENTSPLAYTRRRVQLIRVMGQDAVLASGVQPGAQVVTAGAAELFGTEFGVGK